MGVADREIVSFLSLADSNNSECCEEQDIVMWGDSGVGNFFINAEDLKRLDFSNVVYNWDCC